jgi:hypothetical protein
MNRSLLLRIIFASFALHLRSIVHRFAPDFRTIRARFLAAQADRSEMRRVRVAFGELFNVFFSGNLPGHCVRVSSNDQRRRA